jgi:hypothetical protein
MQGMSKIVTGWRLSGVVPSDVFELEAFLASQWDLYLPWHTDGLSGPTPKLPRQLQEAFVLAASIQGWPRKGMRPDWAQRYAGCYFDWLLESVHSWISVHVPPGPFPKLQPWDCQAETERQNETGDFERAQRRHFELLLHWVRMAAENTRRAAAATNEQPTRHKNDQYPQYVTLNQLAAIVKRTKSSLEKIKEKMPPPAIEGGGGKPAEWIWADVRHWLEKEYGRLLPERFPEISPALS